LGDFDLQRRFNLFNEFRQALVLRFPGLYIPPLPPKKLSGKAEEITLIERTHFLNLFLKECTEHKYIA
jgi:sorting nexin-1/2